MAIPKNLFLRFVVVVLVTCAASVSGAEVACERLFVSTDSVTSSPSPLLQSRWQLMREKILTRWYRWTTARALAPDSGARRLIQKIVSKTMLFSREKEEQAPKEVGGMPGIDRTFFRTDEIFKELPGSLQAMGLVALGNKSYGKWVQFGSKRLWMTVSTHTVQQSRQSDPVYEQLDNGGFVFMGNARTDMTITEVGVDVRFATDGSWNFLQLWAPNPWTVGDGKISDSPFRVTHTVGRETYEYKYLGREYSYEKIDERHRLALDLTRATVGQYNQNGFDSVFKFNGRVSDLDTGVTRAGMDLLNTDPIPVRIDRHGHALLYIHNLMRVMELSPNQYAILRADTPRFGKVIREATKPGEVVTEPGSPYVIVPN